MRNALMICGTAIAALGVLFLSIPVGLVASGLLMVAIAYLSE